MPHDVGGTRWLTWREVKLAAWPEGARVVLLRSVGKISNHHYTRFQLVRMVWYIAEAKGPQSHNARRIDEQRPWLDGNPVWLDYNHDYLFQLL